MGDLSKRRPNWDISPYRDNPGPTTFLPPITPSRNIRTAANSPQPRHRRSDSHFSMTSLPLIAHSPTSFWSSPHFNPSEDSRKPPKEDLWWNPNKRLWPKTSFILTLILSIYTFSLSQNENKNPYLAFKFKQTSFETRPETLSFSRNSGSLSSKHLSFSPACNLLIHLYFHPSFCSPVKDLVTIRV